MQGAERKSQDLTQEFREEKIPLSQDTFDTRFPDDTMLCCLWKSAGLYFVPENHLRQWTGDYDPRRKSITLVMGQTVSIRENDMTTLQLQ